MTIDVKKLSADFLVFSAHKMLGPTGVGALYAKRDLLDKMDPLITGSHMIESVSSDQATWAQAPDKFEPGTRNIEGVIGLGAAIDYLTEAGMSKIEAYERSLTAYALEQFNARGVKLFGPRGSKERLGVFSFAVDNIHPHDIAEVLNRSGVAVRAGHHCAQPLMQALNVTGTARASTYLYNTKEDIDKLMHGLDEVKKVFHV
jgi:cysteine desulfurase / selenocysteine lyase